MLAVLPQNWFYLLYRCHNFKLQFGVQCTYYLKEERKTKQKYGLALVRWETVLQFDKYR